MKLLDQKPAVRLAVRGILEETAAPGETVNDFTLDRGSIPLSSTKKACNASVAGFSLLSDTKIDITIIPNTP
jgi:hypothetical protein